jgi:NADPH-dependent curcumin reductase CurA
VIIAKALTVCGLRVFDHFTLMPEWERLVASRILDGGFAYAEDISIGLEQAPGALARVLTGGNFGKTLVQVV